MRKNIFIKICCAILCLTLLLSVTGCSSEKANDIVILFTNDVNCAVEDNLGYAGVRSYKKLMLTQTPYVTLVDIGNAVQGEFIGTVSKGMHIVDIMNKVEYDFAVLGNHEFDYGMPQLAELINRSKAQYLAANITYKGENEEENALAKTKPYEIVKYGSTKVAFIGVTTPKSITKALPSTFKDGSKYVYDFKAGSKGSKLYSNVQGYVNECRNKGADYVVVLSHLGDTEECEPYTSTALIKATFDIDVVLDAHAGSEIANSVIRNKNGDNVILSSSGSELKNIGKLIISPSGHITTSLVTDFQSRNTEITAFYDELLETYKTEMNQVVALCDTALKREDKDGINITKVRESTLGNFCADAYLTVAQADIGIVTGESIQGDLPVGEVKYKDISNLFPSGGSLCKVKATGQEILDALEIASISLTSEYAVNGEAVGENDSFMHVAGIKYTVDTSIEPTVEFDKYGMFKEVEGERRVKRVQVRNAEGNYIPINPEAVYTVASNSHLIKEGSGGINLFTDNSLLLDDGMPDYQVLISYITDYLGGELGGRYSEPEGRIVVE